MKTKINMLSMALIALMAGTIVTSCGEKSKKEMKSAKENMGEAGQDLKEAASDATKENKTLVEANWKKFESESELVIANTETQIKNLREKMATSAKNEREKMNAELDKLEQKNNNLKEKLAERSKRFKENLIEFNEDAEESEKSFEREFKHDTDELGTALKDIFKNNVK
ncbi:hypothetical protein [Cellulophaga sp. L1A9]|uniref:hypothetical protein n=1 Tax=Cellulophaga sp. L1A9 TaxID=2686362 RepID=UPI00131B895D|nr:hypothetical protein [Cellulophaga sp. L1A9]